MIVLDFRIDQTLNQNISDDELMSATETDLRYRLVLGDIVFHVNGKDFSALWGWIPLIDFAVAMNSLANELMDMSTSRVEFDFTEVNDTILFERTIDQPSTVSVSCSYSAGQSTVAISDLRQAISQFARKLRKEALCRWPNLAKNEVFLRLLPATGLDEQRL
jgi:hypothetical protein